MGVISGLIGAGTSIIGGILAKKSAKKEAKRIEAGRERAVEGLSPFAQAGVGASDVISGALGVGGDPEASEAAFQNFLSSSGFQNQLQQGSTAITGNQAAAGLLNSGSTLKRLTTFGQGLAQQGFSNFLSQLGGVANRGLDAATSSANVITGQTNLAAGARREGSDLLNKGIGAAVGSFGGAGGSGASGILGAIGGLFK